MLGRYTPGRRANNRSFGVMSPVAMRCGTGYLLTRWRRRRRLCRRCRRRRRRRCLSCGGLRTLPLLFCSATLFFVARRPRGEGCLSPRAGLEVLSVAHWDGVSRSPRKGITRLEETPTAERATLVFIYSPGRYRQSGSAVPRLDNSAPPGRSTLGVAQTSVREHFYCQCLSKNAGAGIPGPSWPLKGQWAAIIHFWLHTIALAPAGYGPSHLRLDEGRWCPRQSQSTASPSSFAAQSTEPSTLPIKEIVGTVQACIGNVRVSSDADRAPRC